MEVLVLIQYVLVRKILFSNKKIVRLWETLDETHGGGTPHTVSFMMLDKLVKVANLDGQVQVIQWWWYPIPAEVGFITTFSCSKTYYKHQDSRIMKAQDLKTKTSANSDIKDLPSRYQVYQGRLLTSFQDDAKYEHVGQDTRSQGGKDETKG
ncbi:hypothetical protein Tco_0997538 [Tanacetum coccineum]